MTKRSRPEHGLASTMAALVEDHAQATDLLVRLVNDCRDDLGADLVALLAMDTRGDLVPLATTSHHDGELAVLHAVGRAGPAHEAAASGVRVVAAGEADLRARWDAAGEAIIDAGFAAAAAYPVQWRRSSLGALLVLRESADVVDGDSPQVYADTAALALSQVDPPTTEQVHAGLQEAIASRAVVEQAKGVLAYLEGVSLERAYDLLLERAASDSGRLTLVATRVIQEQVRRPGP